MSKTTVTRKIGSNRGKARLWIEGTVLSSQGWNKGTRFDIAYHEGSIVITRKEDGARKVAGDPKRPIIDTNSDTITEALGMEVGQPAKIEIEKDTITITKAPPGLAERIKEADKRGAITALAIAAGVLPFTPTPTLASQRERILVGCELHGQVRDRLIERGHDAISCDIFPSRSEGPPHVTGDVRELLGQDWDKIIAFPPCPMLTNSAAWAFKDPDYDRYPGVGYHQKVKPGTLTGAARRDAREEAVALFMAIWEAAETVAIENPTGHMNTRFKKPDQTIHPHWFGTPHSKATCLQLKNLPLLTATDQLDIEQHGWLAPNGVWRWQNQTASGQNNLAPSANREEIRSTTYPGIALAMAMQWTPNLFASKPNQQQYLFTS